MRTRVMPLILATLGAAGLTLAAWASDDLSDYRGDVPVGHEVKAYGSARSAYVRVQDTRSGGSRDFRIVVHKPAGTDFAEPATAVLFTGDDPGNGQDASGTGVSVTSGVAFARGFRPMIRTPRGTAISPGSCLAVEVTRDRERIMLLEGSVGYVWLQSNPKEVVTIQPRRYVEIARDKAGNDDFVRDGNGQVVQYDADRQPDGTRLRDMVDYQSIP